MKLFSHFFNKNNIKQFKKVGNGTTIPDSLDVAGYSNISIGSHTFIGPRCTFYSTKATLSIGSHVMVGPEVMIITGDHRIDVEGIYMDEITDDMKLPKNDQPVIIEDNVWIGARAIILKGVKIGTGSVIAAGAIVLKNVPPYTIYYSKNKQKNRFIEKTKN